MSVTLTDQQWAAVKEAASWYAAVRAKIDAEGYMVQAKKWSEEHERFIFHEIAVCPGLPPFVFAGFAGTGKSTCVGAMIEHLGLDETEVLYMAPTGKAAKVLTHKLFESGWRASARTIHKTIYKPRTEQAEEIANEIEDLTLHAQWMISKNTDKTEGRKHNDPDIWDWSLQQVEQECTRLEFELQEVMDAGDGLQFSIRSHDDLPPKIKLFVVDEASMVGTSIMQDLESFGLPILAIGDPGQLPPVKDTWGFAMGDPDVFLQEIHRQAEENPIIRLATMAREGRNIPVGDYGDGVRVIARRDDDMTYNLDEEPMILCGTNKKRWGITKKLRMDVMDLGSTGPVEDEPLIVRRNSQDHPALVNGSIVRCAKTAGDLEKGRASFKLEVTDHHTMSGKPQKYELDVTQGLFEEHLYRKKGAYSAPSHAAFRANQSCHHVDFGHVLTVHNSQGSEFDEVVLHDESPAFRADSARWLYTGITRASEKLTVVT